MYDKLSSFYSGKKVFVTGHTGFKGSWLSVLLLYLGAEVAGFSHMEYPLFNMLQLNNKIKSFIGDIRDYSSLSDALNQFQPDIVLHLAAQPLVIDSYKNPIYTYETNVMGTVNLLEAVRFYNSVKTVVNVTTDKVYQNNEWCWGYRESDRLGGYDPYSNSKSCAELVTDSFRKSFYNINKYPSSATARAGNVIGGGDFSENRIVPDCIRAAKAKREIIVRNPGSVRPWQHVIEPLWGYLTLARAIYNNETSETSFNFGPNEEDCISVSELVSLFCSVWGDGASWKVEYTKNNLHEANLLKLDCSKAKSILGWKPRLNVQQAVNFSVGWQKSVDDELDAFEITYKQIGEYADACRN